MAVDLGTNRALLMRDYPLQRRCVAPVDVVTGHCNARFVMDLFGMQHAHAEHSHAELHAEHGHAEV